MPSLQNHNLKEDVRARVPGKVMLIGEYAVLHGEAALAATVDCFLEVLLTPNQKETVRAYSSLWPQALHIEPSSDQTKLSNPEISLLLTVKKALELFPCSGFDLKISSKLDVRFGMGSSSALRLATLLAIANASRKTNLTNLSDPTLWQIASTALSLQQNRQHGVASGYDIVTQMLGGLVLSTPAGAKTNQLEFKNQKRMPIGGLEEWVHIYVGGEGSPTADLVSQTMNWLMREGKNQALVETTRRLRHLFCELLGNAPQKPPTS